MIETLKTIATIIVTLTPISYILLYISNKTKKSEIKSKSFDCLVCNLNDLLITEKEKIRTIINDTFTNKIRENNKNLEKTESINFIAMCSHFCDSEKLKEINSELKSILKINEINIKNIVSDLYILQEIKHEKTEEVTTKILKNKTTNEIYSISIGTIENIKQKCTKYFNNNKKEDLTDEILNKQISKLKENGEKITCFAYKQLPFKQQDFYTNEFCENDMTLTCIIGSLPEINKNLSKDFEDIKKENIRKILITEETKEKAIKIAKESKFISDKHFLHIDGKSINEENLTKFEKEIEGTNKEIIFSNTTKTEEETIKSILKDINLETVETKNINNKNKINSIIKEIKKEKNNIIQIKNIRNISASYKLSLLMIIITAIALNAPMPFTIGTIILIEIAFILLPTIINKHISTETENFQSLTKSISRGMILSTIYIFLLINKGFNISEKITQNDQAFIFAQSIIFLITITLITSSIYNKAKNKIERIYIVLGISISTLTTYALINTQEINKILKITINNNITQQIALFVLILIIITNKTWKLTFPKRNILE